MSKDLVTQLADYGDYCGQRQGSVALDDITSVAVADDDDLLVFDIWESEERPAHTKVKFRAKVLATVATVILLAVGAVIVAERRDSVVPGPALAPTGTVPVSTLAEGSPAVQSRGDERMKSVTVGGPGLVAVGSVGDDAGGMAVWTSVDGDSWSQVPHDEAVSGGEVAGDMWSVTAGGPGLVAVGGASIDIDGREVAVAAVWTSVDGFTWSRVPHDEDVFGGARMWGVTVGGSGLIAVGAKGADAVQDAASTSPTPTCPWRCDLNFSATSTPDRDAEDWDAAVWTSVDGITWSQVPHDEAVFGGANNQEMWDVTVGGPGLVAVGKDGEGEIDHSLSQVAAVWTSVDGLAWSRVPHDETVFGNGAMWSVTAGGPGLVAVGGAFERPHQVGAVWTSVDGLAWSRVSHDETVFGSTDNWPMLSVAAAGPGLVAVGGDAVWTSVDGMTWSRLPYDAANYGIIRWSVIDAGDRYVAVGDANGGVAVSLGPRED